MHSSGTWLAMGLTLAVAQGCHRKNKKTDVPAGKATMNNELTDLDMQTITTMPDDQTGGRAVVVLHGWGAPADDLVPVAQLMLKPDVRMFVPAAPFAHPMGGRAWWHIDRAAMPHADGNETELPTDAPPEFSTSRKAIQDLLHAIKKRYQPQSLSIIGFSQGAMLAVDRALAADPPVDRVAAMSGSLLLHSVANLRAAGDTKPSVFVAHGQEDSVLPFATGQRLKKALQAAGFDVTWHPFDGPHTIPPDVVDAVQKFLER